MRDGGSGGCMTAAKYFFRQTPAALIADRTIV
jgi:hypothetical protein